MQCRSKCILSLDAIDLLPKFDLMDNAGIEDKDIDYYVINKPVYDFQRESLKLLNISLDKIIESSDSLHVKSALLIVPSQPGEFGHVSKYTCNFLRKLFLQVTSNISVELHKRIFIKRGNVRHRRLINEDEVSEHLGRYGFEPLSMDGLSIVEQAAVFNFADVIISTHGSALTNLVFSKEKSRVLEILSPNYMLGVYWQLSSQLGIDYYYITGLGDYKDKTLNLDLNAEDILVDINSLDAIVSEILLN